MAYPTRQQLATKITSSILANSPLTTVGSYSALQALANAVAAVISDFYRDLQVQVNEDAQQGIFDLFDFSALSPLAAEGTVVLRGTPSTVVLAGTSFSTVGSSGNPAVLFQSTAAVTLLCADPTTAPTLAQSNGASTFTDGDVLYITQAYGSATATGPTLTATSPATLTIAVSGNVVTTSIALPVGADFVNLYVGTVTQPLLLGSVAADGTITYSGSAASGLAVTVSDSQLNITITASASSDGATQPTQSYAGTANVGVVASVVGTAGNQAVGTISNIVTPVAGLVAVTNTVATQGGTDAESLASQEARFNTYRDSLSRATLAAMETGALTVAGVAKVAAVERAYLACQSLQGAVWTDNTADLNAPKGIPVSPFKSPLSSGDGAYIGADRRFTVMYLDVATEGSGLTATWQYLNQANTWADLNVTTDETNNGQDSGTVAWDLPTDWTQQTVNGVTQFWVRLEVTSGTVTTLPTWYQVMTLDPPPGYVNVFVEQAAGASDVLANLQTTLQSWRAASVTTICADAIEQPLDVTVTITPTAYGASQPLQTAAVNVLTTLISGLAIGQDLPVSVIAYTVSSLYAGQAVAEVSVTSPSSDVLPGVDTLITPGTISVTVLPAV